MNGNKQFQGVGSVPESPVRVGKICQSQIQFDAPPHFCLDLRQMPRKGADAPVVAILETMIGHVEHFCSRTDKMGEISVKAASGQALSFEKLVVFRRRLGAVYMAARPQDCQD
ncbi:MAG: hypothetical protein AAGA70_00995 [Pseudomonadota bacterium]